MKIMMVVTLATMILCLYSGLSAYGDPIFIWLAVCLGYGAGDLFFAWRKMKRQRRG